MGLPLEILIRGKLVVVMDPLTGAAVLHTYYIGTYTTYYTRCSKCGSAPAAPRPSQSTGILGIPRLPISRRAPQPRYFVPSTCTNTTHRGTQVSALQVHIHICYPDSNALKLTGQFQDSEMSFGSARWMNEFRRSVINYLAKLGMFGICNTKRSSSLS